MLCKCLVTHTPLCCTEKKKGLKEPARNRQHKSSPRSRSSDSAPHGASYPKHEGINTHPHVLETEPHINRQRLGWDPTQQKVRNAKNKKCRLPPALPWQPGSTGPGCLCSWPAGEFPLLALTPGLSRKEIKSSCRGCGGSSPVLSGKSAITDCLKWGLQPCREPGTGMSS